MTNLEKLENDIRGKLPRLMELTEGCEVSYMRKNCIILTVNHDDNLYTLLEDKIDIACRSMHHVESKSRIIGHPITLSDLLDWLGTISEYQDQYCVDSKGYFLDYVEEEGNYVLCSNCKWDLSKPFLKDQPQELIDYLVTLI